MSGRKRSGSLSDAYERMQKLREAEEIGRAARKRVEAANRAYERMQKLREADGSLERDAVRDAEEAARLAAEGAPKQKRRRITIYIDGGEYERIRACILQLGAEGKEPVSISQFMDGAAHRELKRLSDKYNGGEPFPRHRGRLPGGRTRSGGVMGEGEC